MKRQKFVLCGLIIGVVWLVGCNGRESPPLSPIVLVSVTAVPTTEITASLSTTPVTLTPTTPPATATLTASPVPAATTEPFPDLASLGAEWQWHVDEDGRYAIPYPADWKITDHNNISGFAFSSPETNSHVRVRAWPIREGLDWLATLEENGNIGILVDRENIRPNASYGEQPAFFIYSTGGNGGTMASFFVPANGRIFEIYFQSAVHGLLAGEVDSYLTMLYSFQLPGKGAVVVEVPTAWREGVTLVISNPDSEPAVMTAAELRPYREGIEATVTEFDPGRFVITTDDGQSYALGGRGYGVMEIVDKLDEVTTFLRQPAVAALEIGERVRVIGYPTADGKLNNQFIAVEREGVWQPYRYTSRFDLERETLDVALLAHYPQDTPLPIWLLGSPETVLPYLVDETGNPWQPDEKAALQILAFGILINPTTEPRLQVERVYGFNGSCERIWVELCYPWQQMD